MGMGRAVKGRDERPAGALDSPPNPKEEVCLFFTVYFLLDMADDFIEALRHQIGVLQRSTTKRPKLTAGDRRLWVFLSRVWRDGRSALAIVQPETVVAWHRTGF